MKKIRLIFKTHLDIGFTDTAERVKRRYFSTFIRNAVETADYFRNSGGDFRYVWTVGAWLIREYFEQASDTDREFLRKAIRRGDIVWHALPFTMHSELTGAKLFRDGLQISQELDREFGRKTIAAKMTDVPGHTRGIIAPLADAGVELLHIGINPASILPEVPPVFRWRDSSGKEVLAVWQANYGDDLVCGDTLFRIEMTGDNCGPHHPDQVKAILARYPGAEVQSATLDDLAKALRTHREEFPVVTAEIGDSWIHGVGTDPWKIARFRELERLNENWGDFPGRQNFERRLLEVAEHTWGKDEKKFFPVIFGWDETALRTPAARKFAASWQEQRDLLTQAVEFLPEDRRKEAKLRLAALRPRRTVRKKSGERIDCIENDFFRLIPDPARGCAKSLVVKNCGFEFRHPGLLRYENFTRQDYNRFRRQYVRMPEEPWAIHDLTKPDLPSVRKETQTGFASELFVHDNRIVFVSKQPGFFERLETEYLLGETVEIRLRWFGKTNTRLAHALWASFTPARSDAQCRFRKLEEWIDPADVVRGGGRTLHAIREVMFDGRISLTAPDTPLAAPGQRSLLNFHDRLPEPGKGVHFNLYNNVWGTNFPMWFDDDMQFRFVIDPAQKEKGLIHE